MGQDHITIPDMSGSDGPNPGDCLFRTFDKCKGPFLQIMSGGEKVGFIFKWLHDQVDCIGK
jgi:hypothetical protein